MELYNNRSWFVLSAAIIIALIVYFNLGWFAKFGVEQFGSKVLGAKVSIGKMVIDTEEGRATAEDIKVYNPKEYRSYEKYAVTVKKVNIDTKKLKKGLIVFEDAAVEGVDVYLVADEKSSNFAVFRDNVKKYIDAYIDDYEPNDRGAPDVIVDKVKILDSKIHPLITISSHYIEPVKIADIEMEAIGEDVKGIRAKRAIALVWMELTNAAIEASADKGLFNHVPSYQMQRIKDTTKLPEHIGDGSDKTLKALFGRRY